MCISKISANILNILIRSQQSLLRERIDNMAALSNLAWKMSTLYNAKVKDMQDEESFGKKRIVW